MSNGGITLALGGGGARGLAHLGVIEVLEDAGITIDRVVGVSMGSISGSLYAYQRDVRGAQEKVCAYVQLPVFQRHQEALFGARRGSDPNGGLAWVVRIKEYLRANRLFHRAIFSRSLLPDKVLRHSIDTLLPDIDILDTACPLSIVTIDLLAGQRRVIEAGSLRDAVQGSSSLPAVFAPVPFEGALLCDIGAVDPVPTAVARELSSGPVISSDVGPGLAPIQSCETVIEVVLRVEEVAGSLFRDHAAATSDVTIRPAVQHVEWLDFTCVPDVIEAGRRAAREAMPHVRAVVERAANAPLSRPRPGTAIKRPQPVRDHDTLRRASRPGDVSSDQCYGDDVSDAARGYPDSPETTP